MSQTLLQKTLDPRVAKLLGKVSDGFIARRFGYPRRSISQFRSRAGIAPFNGGKGGRPKKAKAP